MVRTSDKIHQISFIWQYVTLPFTMFLIVKIYTSLPTMNTPSQKQQHPLGPHNQHIEDGMAILNTRYYFFTLPNTLDDDTYIHLIQQGTCLYDLQDLDPEELTDHKRRKENWVRKRRMQRIRERAEKIVQLKRELQLMHKQSRTESGQLGIVWWNREYWDKGLGLKRIKVKKEEPSTPSLQIKVELPPTPSLGYPPSRSSSSQFRSIDLNDFVWSSIYRPSP